MSKIRHMTNSVIKDDNVISVGTSDTKTMLDSKHKITFLVVGLLNDLFFILEQETLRNLETVTNNFGMAFASLFFDFPIFLRENHLSINPVIFMLVGVRKCFLFVFLIIDQPSQSG